MRSPTAAGVPRPLPRTARGTQRRLACALVMAGALGGGGCGGERAGAGPYADLVARYVPRIEKEAGLRFKRPPAVAERSRDEVAVFVRQQLASPRAQRQLAGQEAAYRLLGLIPDTMRLDALLQRLLEEQVVGYYDPRTDTLYVVGGAPKALLEQTVAHELVHALQDQYVKVDSIQEQVEDADRQLAAQAVLEGQAVSLQLRTNPNAGPMMKMPGGWDRIRDMIRDGQGGMPVFAAAPMAIREGLLFPYLGGADFVRRYILQRPESTLYGDLPVSTAQLLHDDAYFTDVANRLRPTVVTLPTPVGGTLLWSNSFGEFETRLFLTQQITDEEVVRRAAGGVTGDRMAVVRTAAGDALVWATSWRSAVDAGDFLDAAAEAARKRHGLGKLTFPAGATERRIAVPARGTRGARTVVITVSQRAGGVAVVTYVDLPASLSRSPIDLGKLSVQ